MEKNPVELFRRNTQIHNCMQRSQFSSINNLCQRQKISKDMNFDTVLDNIN